MSAPGFNVPSYPGYPPSTGAVPPYPMPQPGHPPPAPYGYPQPAVPSYPQPQPPPGVIQMQPVSNVPLNPHIPPGLEYLTTLDRLIVKQKIELLEAFTGFETPNKYTIKSQNGDKLFYAVEEVNLCAQCCCGPSRPFELRIMDINKRELVHVSRPLRCDSCCFPCCLQTITVCSPPGTVVGYVSQEWSILKPCFKIQNAAGDTVLRIEGPFCTFTICGAVEFKVLSRDGSVQVGKISKQWAGLVRELFTDADTFGVSFPIDLDVKMKAVMLAACFLIDYMFFEKANNRERDRPGMLD